MDIEQQNDWKWLVKPSENSSRSKRYAVIKRRDETFSCDCKSFKYGTYECKHIKAIKELTKGEGKIKAM